MIETLQAELRADMEGVDAVLDRLLTVEPELGRLGDILREVAASRGKRYRPLLLLLAARCGPDWQTKRPALHALGAVIELIHMASLIHDDIVDDSPLRRGRATVQSRFGKDMAVYAGDVLLARAMRFIFEERLYGAGLETTRTIERMCRGEIGQFDCRFRLDTPVERYLDNIYGKTVALFESACRLGCETAGADSAVADALGRFGRRLGYLFQIRDDLLDFVSDESREGKPVHADFREGVFTLPVLFAYQRPKARDALAELAARAREGGFSDADAAALNTLVRQSGGLDQAAACMREHSAAAVRLAEALPQPAGAALAGLVHKLALPV